MNWLKQIPTSLLEEDEIPLVGFPPNFPWEELSKKLAQLFQLQDLSISPAQALEWRDESTLVSGLGDDLRILQLVLSPGEGIIYWAMSTQSLRALMGLLLNHDSKALSALDSDFTEGFYRFLATEIIQTMPQLNFDKSLTFHILQDNKLLHEPALCLDVSIKIKEQAFWGRLILSSKFRREWKERYANRTLLAFGQSLNLTFHLEAGRVSLAPRVWAKVKPGDFVFLDACSLNPREGSGQLKLTIHGLPLFAAELADDGIKLLDFSEYQEGEFHMARDEEEHDENDEQEESEFGDEELEDEDEESELEETSDESLSEDHPEQVEEDLEENSEDTEAESESEIEESHDEVEIQSDMEQAHDEELEEAVLQTEVKKESVEEIVHEDVEQKESEEKDEISEDEDLEFQEEKWPPPPEKRVTPEKPKAEKRQKKEKVKPVVEEPPASLTAIPLSIVVEVGRLQMSLQKLLELQPGNLLDLKVNPESGVDLVVNGRRIARGELLLIGDSLGVRILDIS